MKILFSNAPWHRRCNDKDTDPGFIGIRAGSRWPHTMPHRGGSLIGDYIPFPFFLAQAGALARQSGLDAEVRDSIAMGESYDEFYDYVYRTNPQVIVMETSTPSLGNDLQIASNIREHMQDAVIIFTGIHFEMEKEFFLKQHSQIDYTVFGEFEAPLVDLLLHLAKSPGYKELPAISNLLYREGGEVRKNPKGALIPVDQLPWPDRAELPWNNYIDLVCGLQGPQLQILTSRGCPYGCIFCVWPQLVYKGRAYRMRNPADVADEIAANFDSHPYKSFYVDDDTFNINRNHVLNFASELRKRGLHKFSWGAMCRADLMDEEMLLQLKESGLYSVKYGVESADQRIIDEIDKKLDLDKVYRMIELTKELEIKVHLTFTFGLPGDTPESIEQTIDLACRLPNDSAQFSIATPFPGTAMYDMYDQKGWITSKNWNDYDGSVSAVSRTERFTTKELKDYLQLAQHRHSGVKARKAVSTETFNDGFARALYKNSRRGARVLVTQSAIYPLTVELVKRLITLGFKPHVLLHKRFVPYFREVLSPGQLHVFDHTGHFDFPALNEFAAALSRKFQFAGAIIPCSNSGGSGYEQVEKTAAKAAGKVLFKVTNDGNILLA